MNPTVFTLLACVGSAALGAFGTYLLTGGKKSDSDPLAPAALAGDKQTPNGGTDVIVDAVPAIDPHPNESIETPPPKTLAQIESAEPILRVVEFKEKIAKHTADDICRSWRVDVENRLDADVEGYLEVEWLDADGFRVDYANEVRTLSPGMNLITGIEMLDRDESERVHSFRVTEIRGQESNEMALGITEFKDKVGKRTEEYVSRSWRVDVINESDKCVECYVEVEWMDADGHRVAYSNETRTVAPGVNVITATEMLDCEENARVRAFRAVKLDEL
jgi:hypothetical protein